MSEGFDPQALLSQALELQQRLSAAQDEVVEGSAGGGAVKVSMTGGGEVTAVHIDASVVNPDEVDLLEDLVLAAIRDVATRAAVLQQTQMGAQLGELFGAFGGDSFGRDSFGGGGELESGEPDEEE